MTLTRSALPPRARRSLRATKRLGLAVARKLPGQTRVLPDYLIIGAPRSGTTSVHGWICEHPSVVPTEKEILYFNVHYERGADWYRTHFPRQREQQRFARRHGRPFLVGDATASYLLHHWTPSRVAELLPGVRVIVCLRDPVDRAYSQFQAGRRSGYEPLESFEEVLAAEPERLGQEERRLTQDPRFFSRPLHVWAYAKGGRYAEQLEWWFELLPREQFLLLNFDGDLTRAPQAALDTVHRHLGLEPYNNRRVTPLNMNAGSYPPMEPDTRARLVEEFRPWNRRLAELTGTDFGWPT